MSGKGRTKRSGDWVRSILEKPFYSNFSEVRGTRSR